MKIHLNQSLCREYANCLAEAPEVFDIDDTKGKAFLLIEEPDDNLISQVRAAVASCPARAITLTDS